MIEPSLSKNDLALWTSFVAKRSHPPLFAKFFSPRLLPFSKELVANTAIKLLRHCETGDGCKQIQEWLHVLTYAQPIHWNKNKLASKDILAWVLIAKGLGLNEAKVSYIKEILIFHDPNGLYHNVSANLELNAKRDKDITI